MTAVVCPACCGEVRGPGPCPSCSFDIPQQWGEQIQLSIAMTGARTAGKSVLIAVMMEQFRYFLEQRHSTFLEPLADTQTIFEEWYLRPLYRQRNMLRPTPAAAQQAIVPLMWSFRYGAHRYCLALYDAAGEDFEALTPSDPRFRYLGQVDMLVSMVDPLKVEGISAVLDGRVTLPTGAGDDLTVMRQVLKARSAHAVADKRQVLAIVLSKFDVVQDLRTLSAAPWQSIMNRPGAAMQRDPSFSGLAWDAAEHARLEAELYGLLHAMRAHLLLAAAKEARLPYWIFAVSALGMPPSSDAVHRGGITPFRVIEILKAGLSLKGEAA